MTRNYFYELNAVDVNGKTEKKNGLTYLSWAWAWAEVKKRFPDANYTIYENAQGWNYHTDGNTCWVKTGVTIEGIEHIEYLPVMDYRNASIPDRPPDRRRVRDRVHCGRSEAGPAGKVRFPPRTDLPAGRLQPGRFCHAI